MKCSLAQTYAADGNVNFLELPRNVTLNFKL